MPAKIQNISDYLLKKFLMSLLFCRRRWGGEIWLSGLLCGNVRLNPSRKLFVSFHKDNSKVWWTGRNAFVRIFLLPSLSPVKIQIHSAHSLQRLSLICSIIKHFYSSTATSSQDSVKSMSLHVWSVLETLTDARHERFEGDDCFTPLSSWIVLLWGGISTVKKRK